MLRKGSLVLLIGCIAAFGLVGCSDDDVSSTCGDGVAEGNEACDLADLGGMTCTDVVPGSTGTLRCSATCTYDTTNCAACGDGVRQFGEYCDCGTDPANLPAGCTAANGDAGANCSATCTLQQVCGDGRSDAPEDCDCGSDPNALPAGCTDVNGGNNANCDTDCTEIVQCNQEVPWGTCDPMTANDCCADEWGGEMTCVQGTTAGYCARTCGDDNDCWRSLECDQTDGTCTITWCGTYAPYQINNGTGGGICNFPNGNQGYCYSFADQRQDTGGASPAVPPIGICMGEEDTAIGLEPGDACVEYDDDLGVDRSVAQCNFGRCINSQCISYCNWEETYDNLFHGGAAPALSCGAGSNCIGLEAVDPTSGLTDGAIGTCWPTAGTASCDLITGALVSNTAQTCSDLTAGQVCKVLAFSATEIVNGTLIGSCEAGPTGTPAVLNAWDTCTPNSTTQVCPETSICERVDAFVTSPAGRYACVPYCDTQNTDCVTRISGLGGPSTFSATPTCQSYSMDYPPNGPLDVRPSRLGLCLE